jgi:hypothetical protein
VTRASIIQIEMALQRTEKLQRKAAIASKIQKSKDWRTQFEYVCDNFVGKQNVGDWIFGIACSKSKISLLKNQNAWQS